MAQNQDATVSKWINMSTRGLLFQWASTKNPTKRVGLVQSGNQYYIIECSLFWPWYDWKIANFGVKRQSLTHFNHQY